MAIYLSKSSSFVKIATIGTLALLALVVMSLIISKNNYGAIGGIIILILTVGTAAYFYTNALATINVTKDSLILKKNYGQIRIPKNDIITVAKMEYANLTMTYGSQGVFGFIGKTMDGSISLVKNRKNVVKITTKNKSYLVSTSEPEKLIAEIQSVYTIALE